MTINHQSKNLAVLVIDMQQTYLKELNNKEQDNIIKHILELTSYCVKNEITIADIADKNYKPTIKTITKSIKKSNPNKIITCYDKDCCDAFEGTSLEKNLKSKNITDLFVTGIYGSECVYSTAKQALELGFKVSTALDVIAENAVNSELIQLNKISDLKSWLNNNNISCYDTYKEYLSTLTK
jgi:nicotinamidase-related amidase